MVPWMRRWRVACGLIGEQGAESLHAIFNSTERAYNNMRDRVSRLRVLLQHYHMQVLHGNTSLEPQAKKRRSKSELMQQ